MIRSQKAKEGSSGAPEAETYVPKTLGEYENLNLLDTAIDYSPQWQKQWRQMRKICQQITGDPPSRWGSAEVYDVLVEFLAESYGDLDTLKINALGIPEAIVKLEAGLARRGSEQVEVAGKESVNDGPAPPNVLWWKGERYELAPRIWSLLSFFWERDKAQVQEVSKYVWKDEGLDVADGTIRSSLNRLNARLEIIGVPWRLSYKKGYIIKTC